MTFIVVPHGGAGLETRSFEVSYRRLRLAAVLLAAGLVVWIGVMIWGLYLGQQAIRVEMLQRQVATLQEERARVEQLAAALARLEARDRQIKAMLGADLPSDRTAAAEAEAATVSEEGGAGEATVPSSWPLAVPGYVTRTRVQRHPGMDIAVPEGSHVRASGAGMVEEVADDSVYGRFVRIRNAEGYETMYGHLSRTFVSEGARVAQDQTIALSGNTGVSTAPHLHFEVRKDGRAIDPRSLVQLPR